MALKTINIFLASSLELKDERDRFQIEIGRKNNLLSSDGIHLHLDICDDLPRNVANGGTQNETNKKIQDADIFVLLAYDKLGMYTSEEFEIALSTFNSNQKPFIFTYLKALDGKSPDSSLEYFIERLKSLKHFNEDYRDNNELWNKFNYQLDILKKSNFQSDIRRKVFNEYLTKQLIEGIKETNETFNKFWQKATAKNLKWETIPIYCDPAKELISYSFVGIIGIQLSQLFAIGKEATTKEHHRKYIEKCLQIINRSLDILT